MKKSILLFLTVLFVGGTVTVLFAQDRSEQRRDRSGDNRSSRFGGGPPSGGFGGPFGGGPPGGGFGGPFGGGPPGGGFGGPFGGGPSGPGGSDSSRNERLIGMLKAMDANGDGKLDSSEIPEYRRPFVSMMISRLGGDPSKTVSIAELERKAAAGGTGGGSDSSRRNSGSSSTSATSDGLPKDPLVPYFGEKEPVLAAIVGFGQREPQPKVASRGSSSAGASPSQSDQILRSSREIMNRYDKNKNGTLDKDKGEWVSSLPFNPDAADKNRDGRISMTELVAALGGKAAGTMGSAVVATRQSNAYDRLPVGVPDWFFERDKDQDGQISMTEYANGQPWNEAIAEEFRFLDTNNDGFATVAEVFAALKKVDDDKRLKEEQARRELERRRGGAVAVVPTTTTTTTTTTTASETPPSQPGAPPGTPGSTVSPAPGTPSTSTPEAISAEKSPDWKPTTSSSSEVKPIPTNAPYSTGSPGNGTTSRNKDRKEYNRSGSYRSR